jgi:alkyl sulfatase BDS1-like metallo-beta-lactamase superfamily hydrolase
MRKMMVLVLLSAACQRPDLSASRDIERFARTQPRRGLVRVTGGVHVALGYGLANSVLLVGPSGTVVVDTLESVEAARPVKRAFDRISARPLRGIIYTHNHADHVFGASVFAAGRDVPVFAHASLNRQLDNLFGVVRPAIFRRSMRQFGTLLPGGAVVSAGIGPGLRFDADSTVGLIRPTAAFERERRSVVLAGLEMELVHAPGETEDQIFVWLPNKRVLLCGDNFYWSFPNLYTIRGTRQRDVLRWVASLDRMRALPAEHLVPSHGPPLHGRARIQRVLTDYRDAIQYVHDQTVRGMNRGLNPDELVRTVRLPPRLARRPYLEQRYGEVAWSVRSIFDGYLGWFDGNPTHLHPLAPAARARRMAALAGGEAALLEQARRALVRGDLQWVLELTDHLALLRPKSRQVRELRAEALLGLGRAEGNANARHYYLTTALEAEGTLHIPPPRPGEGQRAAVRSIPLAVLFRAMAVHLDPEKIRDEDTVIGFRFPDAVEEHTLHVRRGVAEVQTRFPERPDVTVTVASSIWKEVVAGLRGPLWPLLRGRIKIEGSALRLARVLGMFEPD